MFGDKTLYHSPSKILLFEILLFNPKIHSTTSMTTPSFGITSILGEASLPFLVGITVHLAKGFGKPFPQNGSSRRSTSGKRSASKRKSSSMPTSEWDLEDELMSEKGVQNPFKAAQRQKGKVIPCTECNGTGKRTCKFCQGTTKMVGFLGNRVPCVPCEATGILDYPCAACKGDGFLMP